MRILGIILLIAGVVLLVQGFNRKNSVAGHVATTADNVANSVDGGSRTPEHVGWIAGGGVLIVIGAALTFRRAA
ncbi:MAG TPA: DUF3185 family protein [Opitutaceae bacterium]|nr:DUF3185 family protein [Opitutaceae bacterium]